MIDFEFCLVELNNNLFFGQKNLKNVQFAINISSVSSLRPRHDNKRAERRQIVTLPFRGIDRHFILSSDRMWILHGTWISMSSSQRFGYEGSKC